MAYIDVQDLEYEYDALEPHIDEATMRVHHGKHYATYVSKYNDAVKGTEFEDKPLHEVLADNASKVPQDIRQAVINNGGGAHNHAHFWEMMAPAGQGGGGEPTGELGQAITSTFGSFESFKEEFKQAALTRFGSGWAWLVKEGDQLKVTSTANQDSPVMQGQMPILGLDVWEHAYYLKYQNKRPDYVDGFFNVVNWDFCNKRFNKAE